MNVGRCRPQMWGLRWGYLETLASVSGKQNPCPTSVETPFGRVKAGAMEWLDQIEFDGPLDSRPAIRDVEFAIDTLGMGADGAQADYEFTRDLRPR
jgi:hypothetical protein